MLCAAGVMLARANLGVGLGCVFGVLGLKCAAGLEVAVTGGDMRDMDFFR
jgi:hypothetical protein